MGNKWTAKRIVILCVVGHLLISLVAAICLAAYWVPKNPYRTRNLNTYYTWDFVTTEAVDRIWFPENWEVKEGEYGFAFFDENGELMMFQYQKDFVWNNLYNDCIDGLIMIPPDEHATCDELYGSRAELYTHTLTQDGVEITKRGFRLISAEDNLHFIIWSDTLSQEFLDEFLNSYQYNYHTPDNPAALS